MRSSSQGLWCPALRLDLDESDKRTFVLRADVNEENGLVPIASEGLLAAGGKRLSTVEGYSVCPTAADDSMVAAGKARFPYSLFGWPPSSFLCVVLRCTVGCVEVKRAAVFLIAFLFLFTVLRTAVNSDFVYSIGHLHCWLQMLSLCGSVVPAKFSARVSLKLETPFQSIIKCDARISKKLYAECRVVKRHEYVPRGM